MGSPVGQRRRPQGDVSHSEEGGLEPGEIRRVQVVAGALWLECKQPSAGQWDPQTGHLSASF